MGVMRSISNIIAGLTTECSHFNQTWDQSAENALSSSELEGRWEGEWVSESNQHHGKLRCVITALDENRYEAHFRAYYGGVFHYCMSVPLELKVETKQKVMEGSIDLGKLAGGVYRYQGRINAQRFDCEYHSSYDHGKFMLTRLVSDAVPSNSTSDLKE